ncbi:MAG: CCA tRNA nucleotidyltransferase [Clostridia bacterium]|nr:CCA tRNA nucleotidyltransferase [Clostridia bacterium]
MQIPLPAFVSSLSRRFAPTGQPLYAVGGIVRNTLLSLPFSDVDLCGPLSAEGVVRLLEGDREYAASLRPTGFGSVEILEKKSGIVAEYTVFRSDSYREGHRPHTVTFTEDLSVDARRRDFTVNALYADASDGTVLDPTGGLADLASRRLRAVRDADLVMREDGQRILRMVRFAAQLGFSVSADLYRAAKAHLSNLEELSGERLREEFERILLSDVRYPAVPDGGKRLYAALTQLSDLGADRILTPHLSWQADALKDSAPDTALRLALLLTPRGKDAAGALETDLSRLRFDRHTLHRALLFSRCLTDTTPLSLTALGREDAALLARSDPAAAPLYARLAAADVPFSLRELRLTGEDVMRLASVSGKAVGEILHRAFLYCLSHPGENTNERLRSLCQSGFFSERNPKNQPE